MDIPQDTEELLPDIRRPLHGAHSLLPKVDGAATTDQKLVVVDDDALFSQRLATGLARYGFSVLRATNRISAISLVYDHRPDFAVLELRLLHDRLAHQSGLELISELRRLRPDMKILMVTCYSSIVTTVLAIKAGAINYLSKPVDVDEVARALLLPVQLSALREKPMSADRLRWEHILRIFHQCDQNVSETARRLKMHRRTLQRILNKRPPNE